MTAGRSPVLVFTFLGLLSVATLFPPFNWGEELLRTETERRLTWLRHRSLYDRLPIKTYSFLFSDSKRDFLKWGWDGRQSVQVPVLLHRRLIREELMLEYVLALVVSLLVAQVASWLRPPGRADPER